MTSLRSRTTPSPSGQRRRSLAGLAASFALVGGLLMGGLAAPAAAATGSWSTETIAGMNVFLGMRYGLWDADADIAEVARIANDMLANGLKKRD